MREVVALLVAGFLFVGVSLLYPSVRSQETVGNTLYVGGSGIGNYTKIQDAIENASDGDTIFVYNGTYYENIVVNKTINLIGEDKITTILNGNGYSGVVNIYANYVKISGLTLQNKWGSGCGIIIYSSFNCSNITNNIINNNGGGIYIYDYSKNNFISYNTISNNSVNGMYFFASNNSIILNNDIIDNKGCGIIIDHYSDNNIISNNDIIDNEGGGIAMFYNCFNSSISNNTIEENNNVYGISMEYSSNNNISCNIIENNNIGGIIFYYSSNNTISDNVVKNNNADNIAFYYYSENNSISGNTISNSYRGIYFNSSIKGNIIYHNNLMNNTQNANDTGDNIWYNATLKEGNYWDDYNGNDKNNDGIGDTPYNIPGGSDQDRYPLMMPYDGTIRLKEFYVDYPSLFTMLIIGMIIVIIFLVPIAYVWYKKGWRN